MNKTCSILNIILIVAVLIGDVCYTILGGLWIKGLTSLGFVLIGIVNLIYIFKLDGANRKFCIIMLIGLIFAMLGDIVLNLFFIGGAILFAIGHVFYFIAYCVLQSFKLKDLIFGAVIFVPSALIILLVPIFDFGGILMQIVCIVYALIISFMVGKSISNIIVKKSLINILLVIGSVLFFVSDFMLLLNVFGNVGEFADILCLATYYPAQCFLAYSLKCA